LLQSGLCNDWQVRSQGLGTLPQSEGEGGSIVTKESVLRPYKLTEEKGK
jgi:hypothetical protein